MTLRAQQLADQIRGGDRRLAARLMRDLDDGQAGAQRVLAALHPHAGQAHIVGMTGNPGAGKSTLVNKLIGHLRSQGKRVGVVAIDPTSPFSGGAILGDRIRMQQHATDEGVFIRSLATRGHLGGLSRSTDDIVLVLDAMGHDVILIETVGVGQDEVDVVRSAHSAVVVLVPGLGDEIQALKAGILEIADLFVVNKADRDEADRTVQDLHMMLALGDSAATERLAVRGARAHHLSSAAPAADEQPSREAWETPVLKAVATRGEGVAELAQALAQHRQFMAASGGLRARLRLRAEETLARLVRDHAWQRGRERLARGPGLDAVVERIVERETDPYSEAQRLIEDLGLA